MRNERNACGDRIAVAVAFVYPLVACAPDGHLEGEVRVDAPGATVVPQSEPMTHAVSSSVQSIVIDSEGRQWSVRRITDWAALPISGLEGFAADSTTAPDLDSLTDQQLAERMRAVRLVGDLEYTELHPNVARAQQARAHNAAKRRLRADPNEPSRFTDPATGNTLALGQGSVAPEAMPVWT